MTRATSSAVTASTARDQLVERRDLAFDLLGAADAVHAARRRLERQRERTGEVALRRVELGVGEPVAHEPVELGRRPRRASRGRARARCPRRPRGRRCPRTRARYEYTEYARPRSSRTSWNSRDDMPPPSTWFTTVERVAVGVERGQRAHAEHEVRLLGRRGRTTTRLRRAGAGRGRARAGRASPVGNRGVDQRRPRRRASRLPAAATTTFDGLVVRGVVLGDRRRASSPRSSLGAAEHLAAERVLGEHRAARTGRARGRRACRRASRSLRGSPGAPTRPRRARNAGLPHDVGEDVERELEVRVGDAHVEHRVLLRR